MNARIKKIDDEDHYRIVIEDKFTRIDVHLPESAFATARKTINIPSIPATLILPSGRMARPVCRP
jgi:hypothetical protein